MCGDCSKYSSLCLLGHNQIGWPIEPFHSFVVSEIDAKLASLSPSSNKRSRQSTPPPAGVLKLNFDAQLWQEDVPTSILDLASTNVCNSLDDDLIWFPPLLLSSPPPKKKHRNFRLLVKNKIHMHSSSFSSVSYICCYTRHMIMCLI